MEQFDADEQELRGILDNVRRNIKFIQETVGERRRVAVNESERNLEDARKLLRRMEAEACVLPQQSALRVQTRGLEREIADLERALLTAVPSSPAMGAAALDGEAFAATYDRAARTARALERTEATAHQSEQIGAAIMTDLHDQREKLEVVDAKLDAADTVMDRVNGKLSRMYWRVVGDRAILRGIIAIEGLTIFCMIFFRWIFPHL